MSRKEDYNRALHPERTVPDEILDALSTKWSCITRVLLSRIKSFAKRERERESNCILLFVKVNSNYLAISKTFFQILFNYFNFAISSG